MIASAVQRVLQRRSIPLWCACLNGVAVRAAATGVSLKRFSARTHAAKGWVIGGGEIYKLFLPHVSELHRTIIDARVADADTHFPDITGMGFTLKEESRVSAGEKDQHDMVFQHWVRG